MLSSDALRNVGVRIPAIRVSPQLEPAGVKRMLAGALQILNEAG
jgi:hypothetical protein